MNQVVFSDFSKGVVESDWNFNKVYPSSLNHTDDKTEIWISEERLKIPVGKQAVAIKFFIWLKPYSDGLFKAYFGMVPESTSLTDFTIELLQNKTKKKFLRNPYYYLLQRPDFYEIFLFEDEVYEVDLDEIREYMVLSAQLVEENLIYYLDGGMARDLPPDKSNGWAVLVRARSGTF